MTTKAKIGFAIAIIPAIVAAILIRAWAVTWLWVWFAVHLGLPPIGLAWAVGLGSLASMFLPAPKYQKEQGPDLTGKIGHALGCVVFMPLASVACGYIAHSYMVTA